MEGTNKVLDTQNSNNLNNGGISISDQIKNLLYPECIENSKIIQILNLKSLNFKLDDFLNLKEVKKISESKEEIVNILNSLNFIELEKNLENDGIHYLIKIQDNIKVFSVLNIPQKMKRDEVVEYFKIPSDSLLRAYKRSLFWYFALNSEEEGNNLRKNIESATFEKDTKLKYEIFTKQNILDNIKKTSHINTYQKETHELKADNLNHLNNSNSKWEKNGSSRHNSESLSWRKKSGDNHSTNSGGEIKNLKKGSFFKIPYDKNFKRERFNSEGNNKNEKIGLYRQSIKSNYNSNPNLLSDRNFSNEIEIDISKLKYSITIKNKYTTFESANLLEKLIVSGIYDKRPEFKVTIEDILIENRKQVNIAKLKENTDLQISNNPANKFDIPIPNIEELNLNIPRNNPLANFGKPFNKFDEYDPSAV